MEKRFFLIVILLSLLFIQPTFAVPVEITIEYPTCTENWSCPAWSTIPCVNGIQSRTCTDLNNCGTTANKPAESQTCGTSGQQTGWPGSITGTTPPAQPSQQPPYEQPSVSSIDYSISPGIMIHSNESYILEIKVTNTGNTYIRDLVMDVSGLPENSFEILPEIVSVLIPSSSATFSIEINSFVLEPNSTYLLNLNALSLETSKTASTKIFVSPVTKQESTKRETAVGLMATFIIMVIASSLIIYMVITRLMKKKPKYPHNKVKFQ